MNIADDKENREYVAYVHYLLDESDARAFDEVRVKLEGHFEECRLADFRLAATDMVLLKDRMDERMRKYRESHLTSVGADTSCSTTGR